MCIRTHPNGCGRMYIIDCSESNGIYSVQQTQKRNRPHCGRFSFLASDSGFEEAGPCIAGVKNMPVACFLGRGRIHSPMDASILDVDIGLFFIVGVLPGVAFC